MGRLPDDTRGVSGKIIGSAVNAVLVPPQAERFAAATGVDLDRLVLNVTGWNKFALLHSDRSGTRSGCLTIPAIPPSTARSAST